jgi:predicted secreted protein with PEFG-CTERM motif
MRTNTTAFVLSIILITSISVSPVFGQIQSSITVITDKSSYTEGELITITGGISEIIDKEQITIVVKSPKGNLVAIAQIQVGVDKKFSTEITSGGALMKTDGIYTITVQYGALNRSAETSFEFEGILKSIEEGGVIEDNSQIEEITSKVTDTTISVLNSDDLVKYEITNGKILNIIPDSDAKSLIISIESLDDGTITLTVPRSVLDSTINGEDDDFFVLVDGEEIDFDEIVSSIDRTLTIEFSAGAEQVEIIGTFVIPEFGTIAAMILAVAIISIVAISAKSRLSIVPRY